jgi:hypothetical protein
MVLLDTVSGSQLPLLGKNCQEQQECYPRPKKIQKMWSKLCLRPLVKNGLSQHRFSQNSVKRNYVEVVWAEFDLNRLRTMESTSTDWLIDAFKKSVAVCLYGDLHNFLWWALLWKLGEPFSRRQTDGCGSVFILRRLHRGGHCVSQRVDMSVLSSDHVTVLPSEWTCQCVQVIGHVKVLPSEWTFQCLRVAMSQCLPVSGLVSASKWPCHSASQWVDLSQCFLVFGHITVLPSERTCHSAS